MTLGSALSTSEVLVSWLALGLELDELLAEADARAGHVDAAIARIDRLVDRLWNLPPDDLRTNSDLCRDLLDVDQCDPAPHLFRLAAWELRRGNRPRAEALVAPWIERYPLWTYARFVHEHALRPLLSLRCVRAVTAEGGDGIDALRSARVAETMRRRFVAVWVPGTDGTRKHPGQHAHLELYAPEPPEGRAEALCAKGDWSCGNRDDSKFRHDVWIDVGTPRARAEAAEIVSSLGFRVAHPALDIVREPAGDTPNTLRWQMPHARATVTRDAQPHPTSCESDIEYPLFVSFDDESEPR